MYEAAATAAVDLWAVDLWAADESAGGDLSPADESGVVYPSVVVEGAN